MIRAISLFFFPNRCLLCGRVIEPDVRICADCLGALPHNVKYALRPAAARAGLYCCRTPFEYRGPVRTGILGLKFHGVTEVAGWLAGCMAGMNYPQADMCDIVVGVPVSAKRRASRGYDQTLLIARQYALLIGKPAAEGVLVKTRDNPAQSTLDSELQRKSNVRGCYNVVKPEVIMGRRVLLVDDIFTTGATMDECARTLRRAGATSVIGVCAAFTPPG